MQKFDLSRRLAAEMIGTAGLLAVVVGSGIMGDSLSGGNVAIALLGNTIATGAILVVLILAFGPLSGAHFNPAVTLAFLMRREIAPGDAARVAITFTVNVPEGGADEEMAALLARQGYTRILGKDNARLEVVQDRVRLGEAHPVH